MALDAVGIVSHDLEKTVSFFRLLGVDLKQEDGPDHYEGTTPSGVRIMADSVALMKKLNPNWVEPKGCGVVLCFKQENAETVNKVYQSVIDAGFESVKEPWDAFWGQRYSSVRDPDGNQIDIFSPI